MPSKDHTEKIRDFYNIAAQACALITASIGAVVLAGWLLKVEVLATPGRDYIPTAPSTALLFMALGSALFLHIRWNAWPFVRRFAKGAALLVIVFSSLLLLQFITGFDLGIERSLSHTSETFRGVPIGRMSPVTASIFLLSGLSSLSLFSFPLRWFNARYIAVGLSAFTTAASAAMIAAYWFGTPFLYGGTIIPVALPTAVAFLLTGLGLAFAVLRLQELQVQDKEISGESYLQKHFPVIITIYAGIMLSVVMFTIVQRLEFSAIQDNFKHEAGDLAVSMQNQISENMDDLYAVEGLFTAYGQVTRHEFHAFADSILPHVSGLQAVEWIPRVPDSQRAEYESAARRDGLAGFRTTELDSKNNIVTAGRRKEYFPVYFLEPFKGNESAVGFDLSSNPVRRKALEKARDAGMMTVTGKVRLVQEKGQQAGFLVFQPVYRTGHPHNTVEERRENLAGFALGVFRLGDVIGPALKALRQSGLELVIYDDASLSEEGLLFSSSEAAASDVAGLHWEKSFDVADRKWRVRFYAGPKYLSAQQKGHAFGALAAGVLFTIMFAAYMLGMVRNTAEIERSKGILHRTLEELHSEQAERERLIGELKEALVNVRTLSGMLPICASCKKVRDDKGYWNQIEVYISEHSDALFSHGICPDCEKKAYEELDRLKKG